MCLQNKYEKNRNVINSCYYGEMPNDIIINFLVIYGSIIGKKVCRSVHSTPENRIIRKYTE